MERLKMNDLRGFKAFFFDMDGVVFNSMPVHAEAWEIVMGKHHLPFTARDCYLQEGRTGQSVIDECFVRCYGRHATDDEWQPIYKEKSALFYSHGKAPLIDGIRDLLFWLKQHPASPLIFLVTGSGMRSLLDELNEELPGIFARERMVTAFDYTHGKPDPEPYLIAYEKARATCPDLRKEECCVVENAPLGVLSGKQAGLFVAAVNTGILTEHDLLAAGADITFPNMPALHTYLQTPQPHHL